MIRNHLTLARLSAIVLPIVVCISACSRFDSPSISDQRFHQGAASAHDDPRCRLAFCVAKDDIYNDDIFYEP
jgi:hypothetical protein